MPEKKEKVKTIETTKSFISSVEISRGANNRIDVNVKVYAEDPNVASDEAQRLFEILTDKY